MKENKHLLISLLAALAHNGVIGKDNAMPWHLPNDLKRFKALTLNHAIIMGRKTFDSIGCALPQRRNIVVTRNTSFAAPGIETAPSVENAVHMATQDENEQEIFIIGGAQIYTQALPLAHRLYLTEIQEDIEGDTSFPAFDRTQWQESARETQCTEQGLVYDFVIYNRS